MSKKKNESTSGSFSKGKESTSGSFSKGKESELFSLMKSHDNQVDNNYKILPLGSRIMCFVGKKGSGKTSAMLSLLSNKKSPYHKYFDNIILCSPSAPHDDKLKDLYEELSQEGKYFDSLTEKTAEEMKNLLISLNSNEDKKKIQNLLILDDVTQSFPTGRKPSQISGIFCNSRHMKTSIWVVTHKYSSMPTIFRNQLDCLFLYKTHSRNELESLKRDSNLDESFLEDAFKLATDESYGFLYINNTSQIPRLYNKHFQEIVQE
jgi:Cdc6-like AAA superfamily ATPase